MSYRLLQVALGVVSVVIGIAILLRARSWLRLRHIPGPPFAGFSELWLLQKTLGGRCHLDTAEACEKYGPLVRIGPNHLVTNDPEVLRKMAAVRSPYRRSIWYEGMRLEPDYANVISERDENRHNDLRTKMAAGYSGKENENLEQAIDANVAKFIQLLESKYVSTSTTYKPVDFAPKTQFFTLDVISDIALGKSLGNLEADEDCYSYIKTTEETFPMIVLLGAFPWLANVFFSRPMKSLLPSDTDTVGMGKLMGIAKEAAEERFGPDKKTKKDMIGSFIRHGLTERETRGEILLQFIAGSDTSALAIRATLLYILTNSHVQKTLLKEISEASISSPITDAEARKLPYLQAVIKEGLRIFPPVTGIMFKEVPAGGDTIKGFYVPGGTGIGWSSFGLMRNVEVWGHDAKLFRPERWFEGTAEEIKKKEIEVEMVFGYGKYQCLGKNVAYLELNKIFVELLRNFEFTIVNPSEPWKSFNAGLFLQSNMWMRVTKREPRL